MCKFCENSHLTYEQYEQKHPEDFWCGDLQIDIIITDDDGKRIFYMPCDDDYYTRKIDINYCPMCRRKL